MTNERLPISDDYFVGSMGGLEKASEHTGSGGVFGYFFPTLLMGSDTSSIPSIQPFNLPHPFP